MVDILIPSCKSLEIVQKQIEEIKSNTKIKYNIITSHLDATCSVNRNKCHDKVTSEYIISLDDDIVGFYPGWAFEMVRLLDKDSNVVMVSGRLMTPAGAPATMMLFGNKTPISGEYEHTGKEFPGSCIAFRKSTIDAIKNDSRLPDNKPFDENYIRSCFEDTDICKCIQLLYPEDKFILNNNVKVIHLNELKWHSRNPHERIARFKQNRDHFISKWRKLGIEVNW